LQILKRPGGSIPRRAKRLKRIISVSATLVATTTTRCVIVGRMKIDSGQSNWYVCSLVFWIKLVELFSSVQITGVLSQAFAYVKKILQTSDAVVGSALFYSNLTSKGLLFLFFI